MSIVNTNGQPVTAESPETPAAPVQQQRVGLTGPEMQRIVGAYHRLKELASATIANPRDEAEKAGLLNFVQGALMANAEELFGSWVVLQNEYTPLINGVTGLLRRALNRIDQQANTVREEITKQS